jgi:hypothetical protein
MSSTECSPTSSDSEKTFGDLGSNKFHVKSKIGILDDILQAQKEKHHNLKQEPNRMLNVIK